MKTPYRTQDGAHLYIRDNQVVAVVPHHSVCQIDPSERMNNVTDYLQDGEAYRTLKDGTVIKVKREDVDGIMKDGQRMRVPMMMLDGSKPGAVLDAASQRPRQGQLSTEDRVRRDVSHTMMVRRLNDAWRNPGPAAAKPTASPAPDAVLPRELPAEAKRISDQARSSAADIAAQLGLSSNNPNTPKMSPEDQKRVDDAYAKRNARDRDAWRHAK